MRSLLPGLCVTISLAVLAQDASAQCGEERTLVPVGPWTSFGKGSWLSDDYSIVEASQTGQRIFYLFARSTGLQVAAIPAAPETYSCQLPQSIKKSVDADGQLLVIGTPGALSSGQFAEAGIVEVHDLTTFSQTAVLDPPSPEQCRGFGAAVSISDSVLVIGSPGDFFGPNSGEVYIFTTDPSPTQLHVLSGQSTFGAAVACSNDYIAVAEDQYVRIFSTLPPFSPVVSVNVTGAASNPVYHVEIVGDYLYSVSEDPPHEVVITRIPSGNFVGTISPSYEPPNARIEWLDSTGVDSADGRLAVGLEGVVYVYDTSDHSELGRYVASGAVAEGPFAPGGPHDHGRWVAIDGDDLLAGASGEAVLFDLAAPCEFTTFCYGDGESGSPCLCGNESAPGAREGCRNSTGVGATLRAVGSTAIADDDLTLVAAQGPPNMPGVFVQGETTQALPFFDGVLCMGNPTRRLEFAHFDGQGHLVSAGSIAAQGVVAPGATRHYQLWYRDPGAGGPCGTGANLTNGVRIDWL